MTKPMRKTTLPLPDSEFYVFCSIQMLLYQTGECQAREENNNKMVQINKDDGSNACFHSFDTSPSAFSYDHDLAFISVQ